METPAQYLRRMAPTQSHEGRHSFQRAADLLEDEGYWFRLMTAIEAFRAIRGPEDRGMWIEVYRSAGGGYQGLQDIATKALEMIDQ